MKNTISWEEYELLSYDLHKLYNDLTEYSGKLAEHPHLANNMKEVKASISHLLEDLRNQSIIA